MTDKDTRYPEPFNLNPTNLEQGDRVISKNGDTGTIQNGDNYNRPNKNWELVSWDDDVVDQNGKKLGEAWIGNQWIKKC